MPCPAEQFTLRDLLYSLLLESHNDTAVAIAEHVSGSTEAFADKMNEKAAELGLSSTHFVTPNGLDADEHYTTAKELCLIASYALQNQTFCKIILHSRPFLCKPNKHQTISRNKSRCFSDQIMQARSESRPDLPAMPDIVSVVLQKEAISP